MKCIFTFIVAICASIHLGWAQGIVFTNLSFEELKQKALVEKKLLFIDFHTSWCGPCKILEKTVFPLPEIGDYLNKHFVCAQFDAEKEGKDLAQLYNVHAYPTLLFLDEEGQLLYRQVGLVNADKLLSSAKEAMKLQDDPDNISTMKEQYKSGNYDEAFLRKYIDKLVMFRKPPIHEIDEYLKMQTSMSEKSSRMMEFLINHEKYLILGGEAERILNENYKTYMDIATNIEEMKLKGLLEKMTTQTRLLALGTQDVALYELFLKRWVTLEKRPTSISYTTYYLELLKMKGDSANYKKVAVQYLDSIVDSRSVSEVKEADKKRYEEYCAKNKGGTLMLDAMRMAYKNMDARFQINELSTIGCEIAGYSTKKDKKHFEKWIA